MKKILLIVILLICLVGCVSKPDISSNENINLKSAVFTIDGQKTIKEWIVLGPFPNNPVDKELPDGSYHTGYYTDYLEILGGEEEAIFPIDTLISIKTDEGILKLKTELHEINKWDILDFDNIFNKADHKVAYAFCYIFSDKNQDADVYFGSDDGAKVWLNGNLVHSVYVGRGITYREDHFKISLQKGMNKLLVKVADRVRDWGFVFEVFDAVAWEKFQVEKREEEALKEFLNCQIIQDGNPWDYTFYPGKFPDLVWDKSYLVEKVAGHFPLNVQWFDENYNKVISPEKPGRYAYYVESESPKGFKIRRAGTMYCQPTDFMLWSERPRAYLDYLDCDTFDKRAWEQHEEQIAFFTGRVMVLSMMSQKEGAVLMSYLHEIEADNNISPFLNTPIIRDHDYHLALKRKILNVESKWPALKFPQRTANRANVLSEKSFQKAGFRQTSVEKLREVCQKWYDESGVEFVICAARHGEIFFHESFGKEVSKDTKMPLASITKLVTGTMFAQFVDQELIGIDDPVGDFLPDFPTVGKNAITMRHLFTHTSGLYGHEMYGGLHNPWMSNVIANGYELKQFVPGKWLNYNGTGYNLSGKVMEMVSGKSIFRLMQENFFQPLGLKNTVLEEDLAFSCNTTAKDLATIGQLLLNKGSYGDLQFFSEQTFEKLLPTQINKYFPGIDSEWGIGLTWMAEKHPETSQKGATILGEKTFGHGSATACVLRIDIENDLVLSITRKLAGAGYEKNLQKVEMVIVEGLSD